MATRAERSRSLGEWGTTAHSVSHSRSRSKHSRARMRMWLTEVRGESHAPSASLGDRQVQVLLWPRLRSAHASGPWAKGEGRLGLSGAEALTSDEWQMATRAERSRSPGERGTTAHSVSHSRSRSKHSRARMRMWLTEVRGESHAPSASLGDRQVQVLLWPRLRSAHASGPWAKGEGLPLAPFVTSH